MQLRSEELRAARALVGSFMVPTPAYAWPLLAESIGARVWVKHEGATPTGAFKIRGGLVFTDWLRREHGEVTGMVSATTGNHGQSLALAGRLHGLDVAIVVPEGNSVEKNAAMRSFGAELIEHGRDFQQAREFSALIAEERGWELIPAFHPELVRGVATAAAELFEVAGNLDALFVPIGMGSGIVAAIAVRDLLGLDTEIIGVVASGAPAMARSFAAGRIEETEQVETFADGVATRRPDPTAFEAILRGAARIETVSEDDMADAIRLMYRSTHHMACGAGAAGLAALCNERERWRGKTVAVMHTSSNIDLAKAAVVLNGGTP